MLPNVIRYGALNSVLKLRFGSFGESRNCVVEGGVKLVQPYVLKNVFYLVDDEMVKIRELDSEAFRRHKNKIKLYYGTSDGWSPVKYYKNLITQVPDIDAVLCKKGIKHAFSVQSSREMADMIAQWINES